jgi:hypothetical protein
MKDSIWLKKNPDPKTDIRDDLGRTRMEKLRLFDQKFALYVQLPRIDGICRQIESYFTNPDVTGRAGELRARVEKLHQLEKEEDIDPLVKEIHEQIEKLLEFMKKEVAKDRDHWL